MRGYNPAALKRARLAAGLTQAEVAERAGIARPNYVNLEKGHKVPGMALLKKFAEVVGVDQRDLVRLDEGKMTLRDLRVLAGRSRAATTAELGFKSVTSYANIENGVSTPSDGEVKVLAEFFGVTDAKISEVVRRPVRRRRRRPTRSHPTTPKPDRPVQRESGPPESGSASRA